MRVWLLQEKPGEDPAGLREALRQWADRPANAGSRLEFRLAGADLTSLVQSQRPEALVIAATPSWQRPRVEEVLALEVGLVVSADDQQADPFRELADRFPLVFASPRPSCDEMASALRSLRSACHRQQYWKTQVEQLHQRLNDRIVIERAKGVLVQRLGIGEEEAYKRLRVLSRRQRRQIRDIAQSLLDTQALLLPPPNGSAAADLFFPEDSSPPGAAQAPPAT